MKFDAGDNSGASEEDNDERGDGISDEKEVDDDFSDDNDSECREVGWFNKTAEKECEKVFCLDGSGVSFWYFTSDEINCGDWGSVSEICLESIFTIEMFKLEIEVDKFEL